MQQTELPELATPTQASDQVRTPGYIVIHGNGTVDAVRVTPDQLVAYAEMLTNVAGRFLAAHRERTEEGDPL